jgi:hypothetical protein
MIQASHLIAFVNILDSTNKRQTPYVFKEMLIYVCIK